MRGSGTVVTGTLTGGGLRQDQEIEVLPEGIRARVRGIQSHRRRLSAIAPGNRTAVNLVGVEPERCGGETSSAARASGGPRGAASPPSASSTPAPRG